jgi:hypothetical protein
MDGEKRNEADEKKGRKWRTIQRGKDYEIKKTINEGEYTVVVGMNGGHKESLKEREH